MSEPTDTVSKDNSIMTKMAAAFIEQVLEEFGGDAPPCWDWDTLPSDQFWQMIERIEKRSGLSLMVP